VLILSLKLSCDFADCPHSDIYFAARLLIAITITTDTRPKKLPLHSFHHSPSVVWRLAEEVYRLYVQFVLSILFSPFSPPSPFVHQHVVGENKVHDFDQSYCVLRG
jgi:hypothetical protein